MLERKELVALLEDQVQLGVRSVDEATQALFDAALSEGEVTAAVIRLQRAAQRAVKLPPQGKMEAMLKKGVIDAGTFRAGLFSLGFREPWLSRLVQLETAPELA